MTEHPSALALVVATTLFFAASVAASTPEAVTSRAPRTVDEIAAVLIEALERCSLGDARVTVILEHRRHEIRITGRAATGCRPRLRGLVPEPPPGARMHFELEVLAGRARVVRARTTNAARAPSPRTTGP